LLIEIVPQTAIVAFHFFQSGDESLVDFSKFMQLPCEISDCLAELFLFFACFVQTLVQFADFIVILVLADGLDLRACLHKKFIAGVLAS
jgi:hypothetical protein